ncbi:MAG: peptidase S41, partial [Bacteroidota bacterium]
RKYALAYVDQHRETLSKMQWEGYFKNYEVTEPMLRKLVAQAEKAGIVYDNKAYRASKAQIKLLLKAYIARNIWREQGFYPICHQHDEEFQKALQLFDEAEVLLQEPMSQE